VLAVYESFSNAKVGEGMARPAVSLSSTSASTSSSATTNP